MKTYNKIYTVHAWKDNNKFFTVIQGEGGIKYPRLKIIDDYGSIDLTGASVTYTVTLPRGSEEIVDATIIDAKQGIVEFEIKASMTMYSGIAYGELNVISDSKVLKIGGVNLTVSSATNGHEIEASEQFSALLSLFAKMSTLFQGDTLSINGNNITQSTITNDKLADLTVSSNKLADNCVTANKIASQCITLEKIDSKLLNKIYNNYLTPEMFGAKGDGTTDDTVALQQMLTQAGTNNQAIKLGNGKTYLISNTLRYDVARANFDGNFATIKVSDNCKKQDETYYGSEPKVTGSWSLNSVITVNVKSGDDARYNIGSFGNIIIDCSDGKAKHALKIENEGKTNYSHIMLKNPAMYGIRCYGGNEATYSYISGSRSGVQLSTQEMITSGYSNIDARMLSTMLFLGCADTYATDCVSVDFECGFLTGGADNHFNKCHAWCAYNTNIMSYSTSFTVWGGVATFSQCMIDSTKYGFKFFNAGRALINNCLNGYNSIYKDNIDTFGTPYVTYFATASDTPSYKSTNRGTGTKMTNNEWKADVIGCNFDNLGQDGDGYIGVDFLPINMKNVHVRALDTVYTKSETDALLASKANLVNSSNIFDFNAWAKGLQGLTTPVYRGTLDKVDYNEKSITFTGTEARSYTNGWNSVAPQSMRIAVKPNTKYLFSCLPSSKNCEADVFLNGIIANHFELKGGFGSFTTAEDTTYISIRFVYYEIGFLKVSEIMIAEKESIYLPNKVAEGVPEVADEVFAFEKTTQTLLDKKYDSSNIETGKGNLAPAQAIYDGFEGSFNYVKIGKIVTVALNITTLIAGKNYVQFAGLPFKAMTASKLSSIAVYTTANKLVNLRFDGTWLYVSSPDTTFADGEKINAIITYIIG